jgi:hypothetical protein
MTVPSQRDLKTNKTARILKDAEDGGYGVVASIVYGNSRHSLYPSKLIMSQLQPRADRGCRKSSRREALATHHTSLPVGHHRN